MLKLRIGYITTLNQLSTETIQFLNRNYHFRRLDRYMEFADE